MKDPSASDVAAGCGSALGIGISCGLVQTNTMVPAIPIAEENTKPGFDLSIKYHKNGLARAKVKEA